MPKSALFSHASVNAENQLNVTTSDEALHEMQMSKTTKSELMGIGGLGFTVGSNSQKVTTDSGSNLKKGSVIGRTAGDVNLTAGGSANIHGSDIIAAKDINVTGSDITTIETKSSGLTVSLGGTAGSMLDGMAKPDRKSVISRGVGQTNHRYCGNGCHNSGHEKGK